MRDAFRPRRPHFPRTDEEVEGEVVQPAGDEQRVRLEELPDRGDAREAAFRAGKEGRDQGGVGDGKKRRDGDGRDRVGNQRAGREARPVPPSRSAR